MSELQSQVASACRALAGRGLGGGIGGHVSIRDGASYLVNPLDRAFEEVDAADVLRISIESGEVLDGGREPSPGLSFHNAIYKARSDVNSVVHTHGRWISCLGALRRPLRMLNIRSTLFLEDHVVCPEDDLGIVAESLGDAKALIVPYHGAITVGADLGEAVALHVSLEEAAEIDVRLVAVSPTEMSDDEASAMKKIMESAGYVRHAWDLLAREATRAISA